MITTIAKSYKEAECLYFTIYGNPTFKNSNVFWEYFDLLTFSAQKII